MTRSPADTRHPFATARRVALALIAAGLLAGCAATGFGTTTEAGKPSEPAKVEPPKPEPPMTRSRAATECWMKTEKGSAGVSIDKRADVVTKCIDDKMKAAAAPKT
jgi:hypothetical protein